MSQKPTSTRVALLVVTALVATLLTMAAAPVAPTPAGAMPATPTASSAAQAPTQVGAAAVDPAVVAGTNHTCALLADGRVKCWGYGSTGSLGNGATANRGDGPGEMGGNLAFVDLGTGRTATALAAGQEHVCALLDNATIKCWGLNNVGQLGLGDTASRGDGAGEMGDALPAINLGAGRTATAVTTGDAHTCALLDNGTVKCWGYNQSGQLGYGDTATRGDSAGEMGDNLPALNLGTGRTATAVSANGQFSCARLDNGAVKCWGQNGFGQLGLGDTNHRGDGANEMGDNLPAIDLGTGRTATAVAAGGFHTCAALDNGAVKCWGYGNEGQLGQGDQASRGDGAGEMGDSLPAIDLGTGRTATAVTAGTAHSCAVLDNGSAKCWGYASDGQLGQGSQANRGDGANEMGDALPPINLGTGRTAAQISARGFHTCAALDNDAIKCWGYNGLGQLGYGDTAHRGDGPGEMGDALPAVAVVSTPALTAIRTAAPSSVAVGDTVRVTLSVTNTGDEALTAVTISDPTATGCQVTPFSLAIGANRTVRCTHTAAAGDAPTYNATASVDSDQTTPVTSNPLRVTVATRSTFRQVAAGQVSTCAIVAEGRVKCWGLNNAGQLGLGDTNPRGDGANEMGDNLPTVNVGAGRTATAITVGGSHACALLDNATVKCWGSNAAGQLGLGDTATRGVAANQMGDNLPTVNLGTGRTATAISTGYTHTCALLDNGNVKCWGSNSNGQLGLGDTATRGDGANETGDNLPTVNLGAGRTATAITAGYSHTCALLDDGTVKCWGRGTEGQLGQGATAQLGDQAGEMAALPAINLGNGRTATAISTGAEHTCAVLDNATIKCWGLNHAGQLGQGDVNHRGDGAGEMGNALVAINLGTGRTPIGILTGLYNTCALLDNRTVKCWGLNGSAQSGLGDTATRGDGPGEMGDGLPATSLGSGRSAVAITGFGEHVCAVLDNASVKCWGANPYGQLGLGDTNYRGFTAGQMGDNLPAIDLGRTSLEVIRSADRTSVAVGDPIRITLTVRAGLIDLTNVAISDPTAPDCEVAPFNLAAGASRTVRCTHTATAGDAPTYNATASVDTDQTTPVTSNPLRVAVASRSAYRQVVAGGTHTCAIVANGRVKCWGVGFVGQLGHGATTNLGDGAGEMGNALPFVDLGSGRTATVLAAGAEHTCALLDNGTVKCWGGNSNGQLGLGDTIPRGYAGGQMGDNLPAVNLGNGRTATTISTGTRHTCAVLDNGTVKCWGENAYGQLGLGDTNYRGHAANQMGDNLPTVNLGTGRTATTITTGIRHTCAVLDNGTVKCWGANAYGELGLGDTTNRGVGAAQMGDYLPTVNLGTGRTATAVRAGGSHTCAMLDNGTAKCWGYNQNGQLGLGDTNPRGDAANEMGDNLPAVNVGTGRTALLVASGEVHTCALLDNGTAKCWGYNQNGQLGLGDTNHRGDAANEMGDNLPTVNLGTGRTGITLATGMFHTCGLLDNAAIKCWGLNNGGQLGRGDTSTRGDNPNEMGDNLPAVDLGGAVLTSTRVASETYVRAGAAVHLTLVITNTGATPLTDVTVTDASATSCQVAPFNLAVGERRLVRCTHTALAGDAPTYTGAGATVDAAETSPVTANTVAVQVRTAATFRSVASGSSHSCAILDEGTVKCWGTSMFGQLGLGDTVARGDSGGEMGDSLPAVDLGTGRTAAAITTGEHFTCALLDNGTVKCWGLNQYGQLGLGDTAHRGDDVDEMGDALPVVDLGPGRRAVAVQSATYHTCALLDDGTVKCWGLNHRGQLGLGDTASRGDGAGEMGDNLPVVNLGTGRTALSVVAGGDHTCALLDDGTLKCWGDNSAGNLGRGDLAHRGDGAGEMGDDLAAIDLGTGRTAVAVSAGSAHNCAILDNARLKCWGVGFVGQLGHGTTTNLGDGAGEMGDNLPVVNLGTGRTARSVTLGGSHGCATLDNASTKCWGSGSSGRLGTGDSNHRGDNANEMGDSLPVVNLGTGRTAHLVVAGRDSVCALLDDRTHRCWGYNGWGNLGLGDTNDRGDQGNEMGNALPPVDTGTLVVFKRVDETAVTSGATVHLHLHAINITPATALTGVVVADAEAPDCAASIGNLGVSASTTVDCTDAVTGAQAPTYTNTAAADSDQGLVVVSNTVRVTVSAQGIGGTVREAPSNDTLPGTWVLAMQASSYQLAGATTTGAGGTYFIDLPPGSYRLEFVEPTIGHQIEWYDGHGYTDAASAEVVSVTAGNTTTANADLNLPTATITGTITEQGTGTPLPGTWVAAMDTAGRPVAVVETDAGGTYRIAGLTPGTYRIASVDAAGTHATRMAPAATDFDAATPITLTAGATATADVVLPTSTPPGTATTITGTVTDDVTGQGVAGIWVTALDRSTYAFTAGAVTDTNGDYTIPVPAGDYYLRFFDDQDHHRSEWSGGQNAPTAFADIAVVPGGTNGSGANTSLLPLRGTIAGTVTAEAGGAPIAGAWVAIIDAAGIPVGGVTTAANGTYTIPRLPLGNFQVIFIDPTTVRRLEFYDNASTANTATPATVTGSATFTANAGLAAS